MSLLLLAGSVAAAPRSLADLAVQYPDLEFEEYGREFPVMSKAWEPSFDLAELMEDPSFTVKSTIQGSDESAPAEYDLEKKQLMPKVQDQGACGTCWIFTTTAILASKRAAIDNTTNPENISENPWVGCDGGLSKGNCNKASSPDCGFKNVGIPVSGSNPNEKSCGEMSTDLVVLKEPTWPYEASNTPSGADTQCKKASDVSVSGLQYVMTGAFFNQNMTQQDVVQVLYLNGAVGSGCLGENDLLKNYKKGIIKEASTNDMKIDHWVTVVGYGSEDGVDFWRIRNSWGETWGEQGHFRIIRKNDALLSSLDAPLFFFRAISYLTASDSAQTQAPKAQSSTPTPSPTPTPSSTTSSPTPSPVHV